MTIFDIAGYPHYENVCSNILAFFIDPANEHGLGSLFLDSFFSLLGDEQYSTEQVDVTREFQTQNRGRIDIVVKTDQHIIAIENKMFHYLANDLNDYKKTIRNLAVQNDVTAINLVLSLKRIEVKDTDFHHIVFTDFLETIRQNLGKYATTTSQKWLLYLMDFIDTIERMTGSNMDINETVQFFIENDDVLVRLTNERNAFLKKLANLIMQVKSMIEKPVNCHNQWIYAKTCLVHDFDLSGHRIAFDLYVTPKGWEMQVFDRQDNSRTYLSKLFSTVALSAYKPTDIPNRFQLAKFELQNSDLSAIAQTLKDWMERVLAAHHILQSQSSNS